MRLGTLFLDITLLLCEALTKVGAFWSIENPESSMLCLMQQLKAFCRRLSPARVELHMCAYSSPHRKLTSFLTTAKCLARIGKLCPGKSATHLHEALSGTVVIDGNQICKTKLAQVYPHQLCEAYSSAASSVNWLYHPQFSDLARTAWLVNTRQLGGCRGLVCPQNWKASLLRRLMSSCPQNSPRPHWSRFRSAMRCRRAALIRSVWDPLTWTASSSRTLFL